MIDDPESHVIGECAGDCDECEFYDTCNYTEPLRICDGHKGNCEECELYDDAEGGCSEGLDLPDDEDEPE
jgi:hypothetical protein